MLPHVMPLKGPTADSDSFQMLDPGAVVVEKIDFVSNADGTPERGFVRVDGEVPNKGPVTFYFASPLSLPLNEP